MAEEVQEAQVQTKPEKKKKGPWFWVLLTVGGCGLLLCCVMSVITILCVTSEDFKTAFTESYCESWEDQGYTPEEDPFGFCN